MRIIAGTKRGAKLETLPGEATRPTLDRVKEAVFSMMAYEIPGARVLDLFAGSGAIGLECLSRGAAHADLVDSAPAAAAVIRRNRDKLGMQDAAEVHISDWRAFLEGRRSAYDLIYLDPPYGKGWIGEAIQRICERGLLRAGGQIVAESSEPSDFDFDLSATKLQPLKTKKYGKIAVTVYAEGEV